MLLSMSISKINVNGTEYQLCHDASSSTAGIVKLYNTFGNNEDGTITQKALNQQLTELINRITAEYNRALAAEALLQSIYQGFTNRDVYVVSELPQEGVANTVYRLVGQSTYSDNMYSNGQWITLATYEGQPEKFMHLTQAEYDALPQFEKNNGTYYFVEEE